MDIVFDSPFEVVVGRDPFLVVLLRQLFFGRGDMSEEIRTSLRDAVQVGASQGLDDGCVHAIASRHLHDFDESCEDTDVVDVVLRRLLDALVFLVEDAEDHPLFLFDFLRECNALLAPDDDRADNAWEEHYVTGDEYRHIAVSGDAEQVIYIAFYFGDHLNALRFLHLVLF